MNVKYTILSLLWFLMCYIGIQCAEDEKAAEIEKIIAKENLAIRQLYMLALAHFSVEIGCQLTLAQVLYVLGECNKKNIYQYFQGNNIPINNQNSINPDLLGEIVRKICEINETKILDYLERVNNSISYILGDY